MESPLHTTRALLSALRIARFSEWEGRGSAWWKVSLMGGGGWEVQENQLGTHQDSGG